MSETNCGCGSLVDLPPPPKPSAFQATTVIVTAGVIFILAGSMLIKPPKDARR